MRVRYTSCEGDGACPKHQCPGSAVPAWRELLNADGEDVGHPGMVCLGGDLPTVTPALVARAFRRIPVPTPALHIQPVKGSTLVNFKTNFYATGGGRFSRTVRLLGHRVTLRIYVDHYLFRFGDGQSLTSTQAGASYPRLTNTHMYLRKGLVRPNLGTTWAADYRVDGGRWQHVGGTVAKAGASQRLRVVTATPVLTGPTY